MSQFDERHSIDPSLQPFSILLIEDNDGDAEIVAEYVRELGVDEFVLARADTLSAGLSKLAEAEYDIILLDLHLPDSSGIETLAAICELVKGDSPLVVVLTGTDDQEMTRAALEDCASDFLIKAEITPKSLMRTLRMAVQRHNQRQAAALQAQQHIQGPTVAEEGIKIIRRANRIASVAHDDGTLIVGDLKTASHASEVVLTDLTRQLSIIIESQRRMRGDVAELTIQGRRIEAGNTARDLSLQKLRSAFVGFKKQAKPVFDAVQGDKRTPGLIHRIEMLEQRDRYGRQREELRGKTIREIFLASVPQLLTVIGTLVAGGIGWYFSQAHK